MPLQTRSMLVNPFSEKFFSSSRNSSRTGSKGFWMGSCFKVRSRKTCRKLPKPFWKEDASDKKRIRTKQLQHDKLSRSTPRIQGVHKMWLQEESWADEFRMFTYTADLEEAIFFAVKDAANPPPLVLWTVVLQGGFVIDLSHLRYQANGMPNDAKDRGATFAYEPAVRTQRRVLISPKMRQNCPRLCRLIDAASRSRLSKWQQMSSWEEFAERCSKDGKNTFNTISLCTSAEANALEGRKNVFNQDGFLKFLRRVACVYNLK